MIFPILGSFGAKINLKSNYFVVESAPPWTLYQYRVDFTPEEDRTHVKKRLFREAVRSILSGYLFDGTLAFTSNRITPDPLELFVEHNEQRIRITMKMVGEVTKEDAQKIQVFNIFLRKCLACLNLQLIGRNYFDAAVKVRTFNVVVQLC